MLSSICCRYAPLADLLALDVPRAGHWLSAAEHEYWTTLRAAGRRDTWQAGRILAKRLILEHLGQLPGVQQSLRPEMIHIESRTADGALGSRPRVYLCGQQQDWGLSIAHTARGVLVALATMPGVVPGVDLVPLEATRRGLAWTHTADEIGLVAAAAASTHMTERVWAMKEAIFKAAGSGASFVPKQIDVLNFEANGDSANLPGLQSLQVWRVDGQIAALAVVAQKSENMPERLAA